MKRFLIAALMALAAVGCFAQDNLISNPDAKAATTYANTNTLVPADWTCSNFPLRAKACTYTPGALGILSVYAGLTSTERMAYPYNPNWQQVVTAVPGTYTLTYTITKRAYATSTNEELRQAAQIKLNGAVVVSVPHSALTLDVPYTDSVTVNILTPQTVVSLGTYVRTAYRTWGYRYDFAPLSLVKN